ncbi:MAG: GAF domain-containing protein [Planctomycetales bacterium]|nr:GAF domain-containing protein [Planctomycetales bacterium]
MADPVSFAPRGSPHLAGWERVARAAGVRCEPVDLPIGEGSDGGDSRAPRALLLDLTGPDAPRLRERAESLGLLPRSVVLHTAPEEAGAELRRAGAIEVLPPAPPDGIARVAVSLLTRIAALETELDGRREALRKLNKIGYALSNVTDIRELLKLILAGARDLLSADSGSVYLVEDEGGVPSYLLFAEAQNDSIPLDFRSARLPLDTKSMAGYCAVRGRILNIADAYAIPGDAEYRFNPAFDQQSGYRTVSVLGIPMRNRDREVIGVIQLMNRKRRAAARLASPAEFAREVIPFDTACEELAESLASQAAVAIEGARLYREVETLFETFVEASVTAIEARDPTTAGHSGRVSTLCVTLARRMADIGSGAFRDVRFTSDEITELRYAALLHDFGKIGVRERVLVKPNKLYDEELQKILDRLAVARERLRTEFALRRAEKLRVGAPREHLEALETELAAAEAALFAEMDFLRDVNKPYGTKPEHRTRLEALAERRIPGGEERLLLPDELRRLSIPRGSLDEAERREIESHVTQTFRYLSKIPWTRKLRNVPNVAYAHHEKLDGSGYPRGLTAAQIPLPSKIMTVADIFDALTAADRPYKKAMAAEKALAILHEEERAGHVDREILGLLERERLWRAILPEG